MQFEYPAQAWWLILVAFVVALGVLALSRRARALRRLGQSNAPGRHTPLLRFGVRALALTLIALAVLGPCWGEREVPTPPAQGRDLIVVLDVSRSMLAEDAQPNRLEHGRAQVEAMAQHLEKHGGFRVALIAFAERAALLCPLTTDHRHFQDELKNASLLSVRLRDNAAPSGEGTRLSAALQRALNLVSALDESKEIPPTHADVLLVADGGDESSADLAAVLEGFKQRHVAVHGLGVGDPARGSPIPVTLPTGRRTFLQHAGRTVETQLDEAPLKQAAQETGGMYLAARQEPLDRLLHELTTKTTRELATQATVTIPLHRFQWFLLPAVLLLVAEHWLRAWGRTTQRLNGTAGRASWLLRLVPPVQARRAEQSEASVLKV